MKQAKLDEATALLAARGLLSDPRKYTTGAFARASDGSGVTPDSAEACTFCAYGALRRVGYFGEPGEVELAGFQSPALEAGASVVLKRNGWPVVGPQFSNSVQVNDQLGYEATLEMFDEAIRLTGGTCTVQP